MKLFFVFISSLLGLFAQASNPSVMAVTDDLRIMQTYVVEQVAWSGLATMNLAAVGVGTVNTIGPAVTRVSGTSFLGLVGSTITISGGSYTVASVTDANDLILSTSAGTQSGAPIKMPGTITKIQLASSVNSSSSILDSNINIYCDGSASPGEQADLGSFFVMRGGMAAPWANRQQGVNVYNAGGNFGAYRNVQISYTAGCYVDIVNATNTAGTVWSQVYFENGTAPTTTTGTTRKKWHASLTGATSVTQYSPITLLSAAPGFSGEIESVLLIIYSSGGYTYLEGNPSFTVDGGTGQISGGTEDFFGGQYYWNNGSNRYQADEWGAWLGSYANQGGTNDTITYRWFFPYIRQVFNSSISFTWINGQVGQGVAPGTVTVYGLITYWTSQ